MLKHRGLVYAKNSTTIMVLCKMPNQYIDIGTAAEILFSIKKIL